VAHLVFELAVAAGLIASLLVTGVAAWHGLGIHTVALRALIGGGVAFLFVFFGGSLIGRSVLEQIAKRQLEEERTAEGSEVADAGASGGPDRPSGEVAEPGAAPLRSETRKAA
jgi:hypothetical protein